MVISDTLIFNMQTNLEPLLTLLLSPVLNEDQVKDCKNVIFKLQAMEGRNDTLPLPIVTLKGKNSKKEDQYKQVWSELDTFIEGASNTSAMHKKVLDCLRGSVSAPNLDPRSLDELSIVKPMEVEKEKTWSEERYQQQQQHQQQQPQLPPSDPREKKPAVNE